MLMSRMTLGIVASCLNAATPNWMLLLQPASRQLLVRAVVAVTCLALRLDSVVLSAGMHLSVGKMGPPWSLNHHV